MRFSAKLPLKNHRQMFSLLRHLSSPQAWPADVAPALPLLGRCPRSPARVLQPWGAVALSRHQLKASLGLELLLLPWLLRDLSQRLLLHR